MTVETLRVLFDYGAWANRKLFDVIARLTPEEFTRDVAGSYGSIRNTLVHTMSAEWGWIGRCGGPPRKERLKAEDYPTFESVRDTWTLIEGYATELLGKLSDADLDRVIAFEIGPIKGAMRSGELLHHAANHSVHHRGQVALLLRLLGHAPGNVDILFYYSEKSGQAAG